MALPVPGVAERPVALLRHERPIVTRGMQRQPQYSKSVIVRRFTIGQPLV